MEPIVKNEIRLDLVFGLIKKNWKKFVLVMSVTAAVTIALVLCVPRYYVAKVVLAPEYGEQSIGGGTLGAAASMLGIDMGSGGADAIVPEFYPDIVESTDFLVPIMKTEVQTLDGGFNGTYSDYLLKVEEYPWWTRLFGKIKRYFTSQPAAPDTSEEHQVDPFRLSVAEYNLVERISSNIGCEVDEKTGVITLSVKAQDPLVAATMANVVKEKLQTFITQYRTEKNILELKHTAAMCDTAYIKYLNAQKAYAEYVDRHQGLSKQVHKVEEERLSGEMQLAFNIYNTLYQQKLLKEAEVQKRTPAFTVLQNPTVPVKPAGPKRMIITCVVTFSSGLVYLVWLIVRNRKREKNDIPAETNE